MPDLISPYRGTLVDLVTSGEEREALLSRARALPSVQLSERATCDLEMLATGAFSPLRGFLGREDYESVLESERRKKFAWDVAWEARAVVGRADPRHPLVAEMHGWGRVCVSGPLRVLDLPRYRDFAELRLTPAQVRSASTPWRRRRSWRSRPGTLSTGATRN